MTPSRMTDIRCLLGLFAIFIASPVAAQSLDGLSWAEQKCVLYQSAVADALQIQGHDGLRVAFLAQNDAFIAGGCVDQGHVCPATDQEGAFADLLTVMTMNEGMASTFVPFGCHD